MFFHHFHRLFASNSTINSFIRRNATTGKYTRRPFQKSHTSAATLLGAKGVLISSLFGFSLFSSDSTQNINQQTTDWRVKITGAHLMIHEGNFQDAMRQLNLVMDEIIAYQQQKAQSESSEHNSSSTNHNDFTISLVECLFLRASLLRHKNYMRDALLDLREAKRVVQEAMEQMQHEQLVPSTTEKQPAQNSSESSTTTLSASSNSYQMHDYWNAWAHTLDGALLELLYGREREAVKQYQKAIEILPRDAEMPRHLAQYFHRLGLMEYAEHYAQSAIEKDEAANPEYFTTSASVRNDVQASQITASNRDVVSKRLGRAEDYDLLAQASLSKQQHEKSMEYCDKSFSLFKRSFLSCMTKSKSLHQLGNTSASLSLIEECMKHVTDRETEARLVTWKGILSGKSMEETKNLTESLVGDYARSKIAELNQLLEQCGSSVIMMHPDDGLPTYPSIIEYLKRRQQYNTLLLDFVGVAQDEERIRQVSQQIDLAYSREDSL